MIHFVENKRNYGIDSLRIMAMLMIITLHTLMRSQLLSKSAPLSLKYEVVWFIEIACYCAVDCFVLISGYVGLYARFKISRVILLWLQVFFYSFGFELLFQLASGKLDINRLIQSCFPVLTNTYWFFTQYFVLCFLMPFLNKWIYSLTIRPNIALIGILLSFFSIVPMLTQSPIPILGGNYNADPFFTGNGYSILWFIVMYLIGATLKRASEEGYLQNIKKISLLSLYFFSIFLTWLIKYICENRKEMVSAYFVVSYTGIGIVISASALFLLFSEIRFPQFVKKSIALIAPATFAVYLIHSNPRIYPLYTNAVAPFLNLRLLKLLPVLIFTIFGVFSICIIIEYIRIYLFRLLGIDKLCLKLDGTKINQLLS